MPSFSGSGFSPFLFPSSATLASDASFFTPETASASPPYHSNQGRPASVYSFADGGRVGGPFPRDRHPLRGVGDADEAAARVPLVPGVQTEWVLVDFLPHPAAGREPHPFYGCRTRVRPAGEKLISEGAMSRRYRSRFIW